MSEIPEDVTKVAKSLVTGLCVRQGGYVGCRVAKWLEDAIARAIMAERERAANPTQAVREMAERLREHVDARGGSSLENGFWQRAINASDTLLALVEERDRLAALTNETMEALQKIGEEFGVYGGERRVDGIRRVLTELRARAEAAEAALRDLRSSVKLVRDEMRSDASIDTEDWETVLGDAITDRAALQGRDGDG